SPEVNTRTFVAVGETREFTMVHGVNATYSDVYAWDFKPGRMFTDKEVESAANVVVIGQGLADSLFPQGTAPLGGTVMVRSKAYTVVGVTAGSGEEQGKDLFMPWTTLQQSLDIKHLDGITVAAQRAGDTSRIADAVKTLLRERHGMKATDATTYMAAA